MVMFKNITDETLTVPGIGIAEAGATIEAPEDFHNVNFERVRKAAKKEEVLKEE